MKSKPKQVNGQELRELQQAYTAVEHAAALHRAAWERWEKLGKGVAKRFRIPVSEFNINLKTGVVSRGR